MIYAKGKDEYKFLSKFKLSETVGKIIEIKNNVLFLFLTSRTASYGTADFAPYRLELLDIEKKEEVDIDGGSFGRYDNCETFDGCNLLLKNNKYLYARYSKYFCIYNIENDNQKKLSIIYKIKNDTKGFPLLCHSLCDYDDESFIAIPSGFIYKYDEITNKIIRKQRLNFEIANLIDIIKLKNNNFIAYNKNEILIINNFK